MSKTILAALAIIAAFDCAKASDALAPEFANRRVPTDLILTPDSLTLNVGETGRVTCSPINNKGAPLTNTCAWVSRDTTVAKVPSTKTQTVGVTARKAGKTWVVATASKARDSLWVVVIDTAKPPPPDTTPAPPDTTPTPPPSVDTTSGANVHTASQLSAAASCSGLTASKVAWVHAGTYAVYPLTITCSGLTLRAVPGERARIKGAVEVEAKGVTLWGLNVEPDSGNTQDVLGVNVEGARTRLINNVVRFAGKSGFMLKMADSGGVTRGNLSGANGTHGNLDHGMYIQNADGRQTIVCNLLFRNSGYGFHQYAESGQYVRNVTLDSNVAWNSGFAGARPDIFAGSSTPMSGLRVTNNGTYRKDAGTSVELPWTSGATSVSHGDLTYVGNYVAAKAVVTASRWHPLTASGDTATTAGSGVRVQTCMTDEPGRANIAVWNWSNAATASAEVPGLGAYELRDAENFFGAAVGSGTGPSVSLPVSGKAFRAFVVAPVGTLPR